MHALFEHIFKEENLKDLTIVAASAMLSDGMSEIAISLPKNYTVEQEHYFCEMLENDDYSPIFSTIWVSDGGYIEYYGENEIWVYHPPVPPIPKYPNDSSTDIMRNSVVDGQYGLAEIPVLADNQLQLTDVVVSFSAPSAESIERFLEEVRAIAGIEPSSITINKDKK